MASRRAWPINGCARNWWKRLVTRVHGSRARRAWELSQLLIDHRIPTARPLLLCEPGDGGWPRHSYLATRWIEGSLNLHLYLWQLQTRTADERRRRVRQSAASLGQLLGRMHAAGIANRDLKGLNVVFVERDERVDAYLVDVDGVRLERRLSAGRRARDLARLATSLDAHPWITRADRWRFVRAYCQELPDDARQVPGFWRQVARLSQRINRRLGRQGRPLA